MTGRSPAWMVRNAEPALHPDWPIIDPHHHLWDHPGERYMLPELLADLGAGHDVRGTVYVEATTAYRVDGPPALQPLGETAFVVDVAEAAPASSRPCFGIVAYADLRSSELLGLLDAHDAAGKGRLRGIRNVAAWHREAALRSRRSNPPSDLLLDRSMQQGVRRLGRRGLAFDTWIYHTQLNELAQLAQAAPNTTIVLDHLGSPIGVAPYEGLRAEVMADWSRDMRRLAALPNVVVKLGGLGMRWAGLGLHDRARPPASQELAEAWRPLIETVVALFGPGRCMFESNFPVDGEACSYVAVWNAFKRIAGQYSADERHALFYATAAATYRLDLA